MVIYRTWAVLLPAFVLAACSSGSQTPTPVIGKQLYHNATFTLWSKGTSVRGSYGGGTETADGWTTKWNQNAASAVTASKVGPAGGIRYTMTPAVVDWSAGENFGETYYLRQTYHSLKASLGHRFRVTYGVAARMAGVRGGFYVNAWWNHAQRLPILNTVTIYALPVGECQDYSVEFTMPAGPPDPAWKLDDSQGVEATFLLTTDHPAVVDFCSGTLVMIQ